MTRPYSFQIQLKSLLLATLFCASFYFIDQSAGPKNVVYKNIEDYLQFVALLYAYTILFFCGEAKSGSKQLAISALVVMAVTHALKHLINAKRPDGGGYSFPSGHTALAFGVAAAIHKRYHFYYAIPAYINGTLVGFLRIFHNKHHLRDVLGAFVLATVMSWILVKKRDA